MPAKNKPSKKNGLRATDKNIEPDDILVDEAGNKWYVWELPYGGTGYRTVLRAHEQERYCQSGVKLREETYYHTGERYVEPPPATPPVANEDQIRKARSGWLSPEGDLYTCRYSQHRQLSYELCYHFKLREDPQFDGKFFDNDNEVALENHGWMKLSEFGGDVHWFDRQDNRPPTERQKDVVRLWREANPDKGKLDDISGLDYEEDGFSLL